MSYVIAVLNQKGGAGKSTLSTNLARGLHLAGFKVLLADADPQGTCRAWRSSFDGSAGDSPPVVGADHDKLDEDLNMIKSSFDYVVIDGAPRLEARAAAAIRAADLVLIPVQPSAADVWAVKALVDLVKARWSVTGGIPKAAFVVCRQIVGSNLAGQIEEALHSYGVPVLGGRTSQRVAYQEAIGAGLSVMDYDGNGRAAQEVREILREVTVLLNGQEQAQVA